MVAVHGEGENLDEEYRTFLRTLGGQVPQDLGLPGGPTIPGTFPPPTLGKGDDLPDDCKLYVGSINPNVTDAMLRGHFGLFG